MSDSSFPLAKNAILGATMLSGVAFSATTTFLARTDQGDGIGEALLYSGFTTSVTVCLWAIALQVFNGLKSSKSKVGAIAGTAVLCMFIASVSGLQNQIKLAGPQGLASHRMEIADEHGKSLRAASTDCVTLTDVHRDSAGQLQGQEQTPLTDAEFIMPSDQVEMENGGMDASWATLEDVQPSTSHEFENATLGISKGREM